MRIFQHIVIFIIVITYYSGTGFYFFSLKRDPLRRPMRKKNRFKFYYSSYKINQSSNESPNLSTQIQTYKPPSVLRNEG